MPTADDLTAAEWRVAPDDPGHGAAWSPERTIWAELVAPLLTDAGGRAPLRVAGAGSPARPTSKAPR
ncbi:protein of unknown function [Streptantibioticus cattleyicolor NRRL 8057 = DSM 46488]|nr:protein of unknown function [Streptantibioticus cattleyicolor NRRL 8057 = DSM 46488]